MRVAAQDLEIALATASVGVDMGRECNQDGSGGGQRKQECTSGDEKGGGGERGGERSSQGCAGSHGEMVPQQDKNTTSTHTPIHVQQQQQQHQWSV